MTLHITLNFQKKIVINYVGETSRSLSEKFIDHNGRNKNYHILKHSVKREHRPPQPVTV